MSRKVYAFLVGINEYPIDHHRLNGCVPDILAFEQYLSKNIPNEQLIVHKLLNEQASKAAVVQGFLEFLSTKENPSEASLALFYFSGHGSLEPGVPAFSHMDEGGIMQTILCHDSRLEGGSDLADKELAYLLAKAAPHHEDFVVIMDCCHAGSGTRVLSSPNSFEFKSRMAAGKKQARRFPEDFCFANDLAAFTQQLTGEGLKYSPALAKHMLLSACNEHESAKEILQDGRSAGVFSTALLEILQRKSSAEIRISELAAQVRAKVRSRVDRQTPQYQSFLYGDNPAFMPELLSASGKNANARKLVSRSYGKEAGREILFFDTKEQAWVIEKGLSSGFCQAPQHLEMNFALYTNEYPSKFLSNSSLSYVDLHKTYFIPEDETLLLQENTYWVDCSALRNPGLQVYVPQKELLAKLKSRFYGLNQEGLGQAFTLTRQEGGIKIEHASGFSALLAKNADYQNYIDVISFIWQHAADGPFHFVSANQEDLKLSLEYSSLLQWISMLQKQQVVFLPDGIQADFVLRADDGKFLLSRAQDDRPLIAGIEDSAYLELSSVLLHLATWKGFYELSNPFTTLAADTLEIHIQAVDFDAWQKSGGFQDSAECYTCLQYQAAVNGKPESIASTRVYIELKNNSDMPLYVSLISLGSTFSSMAIPLIMEKVQNALGESATREEYQLRIEPRQSVFALSKKPMLLNLSDDVQKAGIQQNRSYLKAIYSTQKFPFEKGDYALAALESYKAKHSHRFADIGSIDSWSTIIKTLHTFKPFMPVSAAASATSLPFSACGARVESDVQALFSLSIATFWESQSKLLCYPPKEEGLARQEYKFTLGKDLDGGLQIFELFVDESAWKPGVSTVRLYFPSSVEKGFCYAMEATGPRLIAAFSGLFIDIKELAQNTASSLYNSPFPYSRKYSFMIQG